MKKKTGAERKIFFRLVVPYICVLLVPLVVWILSHLYIVGSNEEKVKNLISGNLINSVNLVDNDLQAVEDVIFRMSQNKEIMEYFERDKIGYFDIAKYQQILSSYFIEDGVIDSLNMYSAKNDCTIGTKTYYSNIHDLLTVSHPDNGKSIEEQERDYRESLWIDGYSKEEKWVENGVEHSAFFYTRTMPVMYPKYKHGNFSAKINVDRIYSHFSHVIENGEGLVYVFNPAGELILSSGEDIEASGLFDGKNKESVKVDFGGKTLQQFTVISEKNQWKYCVLVSPDFVMRDVKMVNILLTVVNVLAFLVGVLICLYFAYGRNRSYLSFASVLGVDKEEMPVPNYRNGELEMWQSHIEAVLDENKRNLEKADSLEKERDYRILSTLIFESDTDEEALQRRVNEGNLVLDKEYYSVLVIKTESIYSIEGTNSKNRFLVNELKTLLTGDFYIYVLNSTTIFLLFNFDTEPSEFYDEFRIQLARINLDIFLKYHIKANIGMGNAVDKLSEIARSKNQAIDLAEYNRMTDRADTVFYFELPNPNEMYYYPIELESGLISAILSGKTDKAIDILNTVYEENFTKRTLSYERIKELLGELESSLNKAKQFSASDDKEQIKKFRSRDITVRQFFDYARDYSYALGDRMGIMDDNSGAALVKQMKDFILENYAKYDLSRDMLAEKFNLPGGNYVSKLFNRVGGESFFAFLERTRIEKACELLKNNHPVKDVAKEIGYSSDISFRRAFKKCIGVPPSEYASFK